MATAAHDSRLLIALLSVFLSLGCGSGTDFTCVIFVLDVSDSIPFENWSSSAEHVNQLVESFRGEHDRVGVIVFGRQPQFEVPISARNIRLERRVESDVDGGESNLGSAIDLAVNSFPECKQRRIVIISDGNETSPDAVRAAKAAVAAGVVIDVIPVTYDHATDASIDQLTTSSRIDIDGSLEIRVKLSGQTTEASDLEPIAGRLRIVRHRGGQQQLVVQSNVQIPPGTMDLSFRDKPDRGGRHRYEAAFIPDDPTSDAISGNNRATCSISLPTNASVADDPVLFVENVEHPGAFDEVANRLASSGIALERTDSAGLPESLADFQEYRCVILADVPHSPAIDERVKLLTESVRRSGSGLLVLGGVNSFGVGGWSGTELEKALPVRCMENGVGSAIVLLADITPNAAENFWQRQITAAAIKQMAANSYAGVLHQRGSEWLWGKPEGIVGVGAQRQMMLARLARLEPARVRNIDAAMNRALAALNRVDVESKLLLYFTSGSTSGPSTATVRKFKAAGIQVTSISLNPDRSETRAADVAEATGGRYYHVKNLESLAKICLREINHVQLPPIFTPTSAVGFEADSQHPILAGLQNPFPPWRRFAVTKSKEDEAIAIPIWSTEPLDRRYATILAAWSYGKGRAVAFTADLSQPLLGAWRSPDEYDRFLTQLVTWTSRPPQNPPQIALRTEVFDREVRVIVEGLPGSQPLPASAVEAIAIAPDGTSTRIELQADQRQRHTGVFTAQRSGTYSIVVHPTEQDATLASEVQLRDLREQRRLATNLELLATIADLTPAGGLASWDSNPFRDKSDLPLHSAD